MDILEGPDPTKDLFYKLPNNAKVVSVSTAQLGEE